MTISSSESAINELRSVAEACRKPDWDGYGALPANEFSVACAEKILRGLPSEYRTPELAIESDGLVSMDWIASRERMVSATIGSDGAVCFAWLLARKHGYSLDRSGPGLLPKELAEKVLVVFAS